MTATRYSHVIRLRPEKHSEYLRLHSPVPPEIERLLRSAHIGNYTIFVVDDLLVSYYEHSGEDIGSDLAAIAEDPAMVAWLSLTDPCQTPYLPGSREPGWTAASEVWHLP